MQINIDDKVFEAGGYVYHSGSRTIEQFQSFFGFDAREYPRFFSTGGVVTVTEDFVKLCDMRQDTVSRNYSALGIKNR
jgi:hypothetical protein